MSLSSRISLFEKKASSDDLFGDIKKLGARWLPSFQPIDKGTSLALTAKADLSVLPFCISRLCNLQHLNLSSNSIIMIPEWISVLKNLSQLRLDRNKLSQLTSAISSLQKLELLTLYGNPMEGIPLGVSMLTRLSSLITVDEKGLQHIKKAPRGITTLPCYRNESESFGGVTIAESLRRLELVGHAIQETDSCRKEGGIDGILGISSKSAELLQFPSEDLSETISKEMILQRQLEMLAYEANESEKYAYPTANRLECIPPYMRTQSVSDMSTRELVVYLEGKKANPTLIQACQENGINGADFVCLTEEDLKELIPEIRNLQIRVAMRLIAEANGLK